MPSPFPGMDPYLEEPNRWPDFHGAMLYIIRAALVPLLPPRYSTLVDRYLWLQDPDADTQRVFGRPDMGVLREGNGAAAAPVATLTAPVTSTLEVEPEEGPRHLQIIDVENRRLVTVVELLSPVNKQGRVGRNEYLARRRDFFHAHTNLVEIDLLRAGERLPLGDPAPVITDYYILVSRAVAYPEVGIWPFAVRDPIPPVPIPLAHPDPDIVINLKGCLDRAYDEGGHAQQIRYSRPPVPPLAEPDAAWARELLARRPQ